MRRIRVDRRDKFVVVRGLLPVLGLVGKPREGERALRGVVVVREVLEVEVVDLLRTGERAQFALLRGEPLQFVARRARPRVVHAGEPLHQVLLRRVGRRPVGLLLLRVLRVVPEREVAVGQHRHGAGNLLGVRELLDERRIGLDGRRAVAGPVDRERILELHAAHLLHLVRRDLDGLLEVRLVARENERRDVLVEPPRRARAGRLGVLHVDVDRVVEGAETVALAVLAARAEQHRLDLLLVRLLLLRLGLRALPQHLREQVAALGHRAHAHVAAAAVRILLQEAGVDLRELRHVFVDEPLGLLHVAVEHLDVRLHRNRLAEDDDELVLPEQLVHDLRRLGQVVRAHLRLLGILHLLREADEQRHVLHRDGAPALLGRARLGDLREEARVHLHGLAEVLLVHADLRPLESGLHVEVQQVGAGLLHGLEELLVDLAALFHLGAGVVGVGHREAQRPVFAALLVLHAVDDLLHVGELTEAQVALDLQHLELGPQLRPLLLRRVDDRLREVRHVRVDERADVLQLLLHRGVFGLGRGRLGRIRRPHRRDGRECTRGKNRERQHVGM